MTNLLEAAHKALPGLEWDGDDCEVGADIPNVGVATLWKSRDLTTHAQITLFTASTIDRPQPDAAEWLRAQITDRRDALTAALGDGWIPVGERLPDTGRNVPLWTDNGLLFGSRGLVDSETWLWADQYGDTERFADVVALRWLDCQPPEVKP